MAQDNYDENGRDEFEEHVKKKTDTLQFLFHSSQCYKSSPSVHALRLSILFKLNPSLHRKYLKDLSSFCRFCFLPWREGFYKMKIIPQKISGKGMKKLMKKKEKSPNKLLMLERKLLKLAERECSNKLVLTCLKCKKDTVKIMKKKTENKEVFSGNKEVFSDNKEVYPKKKKKKKKDKFANLCPEVVLKAKQSNAQAIQVLNISAIKKKKRIKLNNESINNSEFINSADLIQHEDKTRKEYKNSKNEIGTQSFKTKSEKVIPTSLTYGNRQGTSNFKGKQKKLTSELQECTKDKSCWNNQATTSFLKKLGENELLPLVQQKSKQKTSLLEKRRALGRANKKRKDLIEYLSKGNKPGSLKDYLKSFGKSINTS